MEMEDPFLSDLNMPAKIGFENGYLDDFSASNPSHHHISAVTNGSPELLQMWPYNERLTNSANASAAAAMSGRSNRSHFSMAARNTLAGRLNLAPQDPDKVLDIVRKTLQKDVNKDIHAVLQKYVKEYFEPAMDNLKSNIGQQLVNEEHLNDVLVSVLEEAKRMYEPTPPLNALPPHSLYPTSVSPYSNISEGERLQEPFARYGQRRESDGDSYSSGSSAKRPKADRPKLKPVVSRGKVIATPKVWKGAIDMDSIDENTKFILGSAANKVLGYGAARGRIYVKHPDLFKYVGDQEDKQWLFENRIMTAAGGKAFLVLSEDIKEILRTDDPTVKRLSFSTAKEFTIPSFMLKKVQRGAADYATSEGRSRSGSNVSNISQESRALTEPLTPGENNDLNEPASLSQQERQVGTSSMNYEHPGDGHGDPFHGPDSSGDGFFSPLNDRDAFDSDNVFASDDHEFSHGLSLDAINPTIGALDHAHDLNHLDF